MAAKTEAALTTYLIFQSADGVVWKIAGEETASSADAARNAWRNAHKKDGPHFATVPTRSWNPKKSDVQMQEVLLWEESEPSREPAAEGT